MSRSGLYLLANTALTGILGLVYWVVAARLYTPADVGRGGALISAAALLSGIGQLNLSGLLMRFLPRARGRSRQLVRLSYAAACATAAALSVAAGAGVFVLSPAGSPLRLSLGLGVLFAAAVVIYVISTLQDNVLVALRRTVVVPIENAGFGVAKLALLVVLAQVGTWKAVLGSWMLPLLVTVPLINWLLFRRMLPRADGPQSLRSVPPATRRHIAHFAIGDAGAGILTQTWVFLMPILVAATLGSKVNALFYVAFLFMTTLNLVSANLSLPLVVEGAHHPERLFTLCVATLKRIYLVLVPLVAVFGVGAPIILRLYGHEYAAAASTLRLLTLSCLPAALLSVFNALCRVRAQTYRSAFLQGLTCFGIVAGTLFVAHRGVTAVAIVILCVQGAVSVLAVAQILRWRPKKVLPRAVGDGGGVR